MIIRPASENDLIEVHRLLESLENVKFEIENFKKVYCSNLKNPNFHYFIADEAEQVLGFISLFEYLPLYTCTPVGEIQELIVDSNFRSKNIGEKLLKHVEALAKNKNWNMLELTSNKIRVRAHAFYIKNGFNSSHFRFKKLL